MCSSVDDYPREMSLAQLGQTVGRLLVVGFLRHPEGYVDPGLVYWGHPRRYQNYYYACSKVDNHPC